MLNLKYYSKLLVGIGGVSILSSCEPPKEKGKPEVKTAREKNIGDEVNAASDIGADDSRYSEWMSRAEMQLMLEQLPKGNYFSAVEGKEVNGLNQYRAITEPFQSDLYDEWAVFWGLTEKEMFDYEIGLLRIGFKRECVQVYLDSSGIAIHQLVMLSPKGSKKVMARGSSEFEKALPEQLPNEVGSNEVRKVIKRPVSEAQKPLVLEDDVKAPSINIIVDDKSLDSVKVVKPVVVAKKIEVGRAKPKPKEIVVTKKPVAKPIVTSRKHIVKAGDTLYGISRQYKVTVEGIREVNNLK